MTMKSDAQFEEKLTCGLEMTWVIWQLFVYLYVYLQLFVAFINK